MKALFLNLALVFSLLFGGCATRGGSNTAPIVAPSVANVKHSVQQAQASVTEANKAAERQLWNISNSKDFSRRIDNKATVLLEYWNSAK